MHASEALAVHLVPLRLEQGPHALLHINRLRSAQNLVRKLRVRVQHQLQSVCGEVKDHLPLQPHFDVSAREPSDRTASQVWVELNCRVGLLLGGFHDLLHLAHERWATGEFRRNVFGIPLELDFLL